jgi:crotonobetaine/carnitine-CoA ligase
MWQRPSILRERYRTHADKRILECPLSGESWTYREMLERSEHAARALLAGAASPGDRLVIMSSNRPEFVFAWFAAALGGLVETPLNTALRGSFLEHQIRTTQPTVCAIEAEHAREFVAAAGAGESIRRFYVIGSPEEAAPAIGALEAAGWEAEPFDALFAGGDVELPDIRTIDPGAIFFTSGTTGPAKGVIMPHKQIAFFADQLRSVTRLTEDDRYMACNPLFHGNAQFLAAYPALIAGATFVLRERYSASNWAAWIRDGRVTVTNLMGVMFDFVWKQPPLPDDGDNELRCIFAIPTPAFAAGFKERFGVETFVEAYGMTEVSMPMLTPYGEPYPPGACGLLVDEWFDVRIVDPETDEELPVGELGELVIRPREPWTTNAGYYGMPDRTADAYRNLWFHTGDGVRRDEEGWFYFVDRLNDTIRRRGENISSYEVEQTILEHAAVTECAAVATKADDGTEDEIALFVVAGGGAIDEDEVRAWAEQRLPRFALPRDVYLVDDLPKTASGKIKKAELRDDAKARHAQEAVAGA